MRLAKWQFVFSDFYSDQRFSRCLQMVFLSGNFGGLEQEFNKVHTCMDLVLADFTFRKRGERHRMRTEKQPSVGLSLRLTS